MPTAMVLSNKGDIDMKTCCKINIGLYVTERRPDGYHNLQTVFYPIPLCDELLIREAEEDSLLITGIPVNGELHDNLVMRALRLVRQYREVPPVSITLHKCIPSGAGLGGGSSDAAAMMRLLNETFHLGFSDDELEGMVGTLGADCAFFVRSQPTFAEGIGNEFSSIDIDLSGWFLVLVKPEAFVSTKEAYSRVTPAFPTLDLHEALARPVEQWRSCVFNDFEKSVFALHPVVEEVKRKLYSLGASYACMSGSGSSVFGLFRALPPEVEKHFQGHFCFCCPL